MAIESVTLLTLIAIVFFLIRIAMDDYRIEGIPVLFGLVAGIEVIADGYVTYGLCVMCVLVIAFFVHLSDRRLGR